MWPSEGWERIPLYWWQRWDPIRSLSYAVHRTEKRWSWATSIQCQLQDCFPQLFGVQANPAINSESRLNSYVTQLFVVQTTPAMVCDWKKLLRTRLFKQPSSLGSTSSLGKMSSWHWLQLTASRVKIKCTRPRLATQIAFMRSWPTCWRRWLRPAGLPMPKTSATLPTLMVEETCSNCAPLHRN